MRLLKYPLEGISGNVTSLVTIDAEYVVVCGSRGDIQVWHQQQLLDTAFDRCTLETLKPKYSFTFELKDDEDELVFAMGDRDCLYLGTEHSVYSYSGWLKALESGYTALENKLIYTTVSQSIITDVKWDSLLDILFVLTDRPCKIHLFDTRSANKKEITSIALDKNSKPLTGVVDPSGAGTFTVLTSDRSIVVYHINRTGDYKEVKKLSQHVLVYPLHYKITMPPQADFLPIINSLKGSSGAAGSTATVLLNRNENYKVMSTLVPSASSNTKVLVHSPKMYEKANLKRGTISRYNLVATSTNTDGSIMIWNTKRGKPLFAPLNISDSAINDMIWSSNGLTLFAVSNDNVLYTFAFLQDDLGKTVPMEEIENIRQSNIIKEPLPIAYVITASDGLGDISTSKNQGLGVAADNSSNILSTDTNTNEKNLSTVNTTEPQTNSQSSSYNNKPESKLDSSKSEITSADSSDEKAKNLEARPIEAKNKKILNGKNLESKSSSVTTSDNIQKKVEDSKSNISVTATEKKTKPDKKSIKSENGDSKVNKAQNTVSPKESHTADNKSTTPDFKNPSYQVPKDLKRKPKEDALGNAVTKRAKKDLEPVDFLDTGLLLPNVAFSRVRLSTPLIRMNIDCTSSNDSKILLNIRNGSGNEQKPTIVKLLDKTVTPERTLFQDFIPKFVSLATSGDDFWACSSEDGTLYILNDVGRKIIPPLTIGVPISFLEACGKYLLCVSSIGELYCWNIASSKLEFPVTTIFPLLSPSIRYSDDILTRAENITMCSVTNNGFPIATLSNGDGYMYDKNMETWLLVSDGWWAYGSQYWDSTNNSNLIPDSSTKPTEGQSSNEISKASIVTLLEKKTNNELTRKGRIKNLRRFARTILMKEGFENIEEIVTLSHLENKLLVTLRLEEQHEFKKLIKLYAVKLGELGYVDRLRDLFAWIISDSNDNGDLIPGINRKELVKSLLTACADLRSVQRVTIDYADMLGYLPNDIFFDCESQNDAGK
ncbi:uncharacterized protein HLK63_L00781 [Nakaseomyces glabratus]|nr:uncharacterized protein GW608_L00781 [Nakaseomyces glabratus]UCS27857.1 uncharacterized protein HLK63_L00781 [Nakaseomyces glabratus]UCS33086.1 uncharacterized protein HLK64_L00781 [Nakaseomyces glabratus]UCS38315.1 uncharacterized protein HLK62_L00781 [Nakaseomyces glabratus]